MHVINIQHCSWCYTCSSSESEGEGIEAGESVNDGLDLNDGSDLNSALADVI
jgi:hypothetical protein